MPNSQNTSKELELKKLSLMLVVWSFSIFAQDAVPVLPAMAMVDNPPTFSASGAQWYYQNFRRTGFRQPATPMLEKQVEILIFVMNSPGYARLLQDRQIGNGKMTAVDLQKTAEGWTARFDFLDVQGNEHIPGGPQVNITFSAFATMKRNDKNFLEQPVFTPIAKPMQAPGNPAPQPTGN